MIEIGELARDGAAILAKHADVRALPVTPRPDSIVAYYAIPAQQPTIMLPDQLQQLLIAMANDNDGLMTTVKFVSAVPR